MNISELIYKLNLFYFSDLWHFIGLLLIIFAIQGRLQSVLLKLWSKIKSLSGKIFTKYKDRQFREHEHEKLKMNMPEQVKRFATIGGDRK